MMRCSHLELNTPKSLPKETNLYVEKCITYVKICALVRNTMIFIFISLLMEVSGGIQLEKSEISVFMSTCKVGAYNPLIFS